MPLLFPKLIPFFLLFVEYAGKEDAHTSEKPFYMPPHTFFLNFNHLRLNAGMVFYMVLKSGAFKKVKAKSMPQTAVRYNKLIVTNSQ